MRKLLLAFLLLVAASAAAVEFLPQQDGSVFIKLSSEEAAACKTEGGCVIVTREGFQAAVLRACGVAI